MNDNSKSILVLGDIMLDHYIVGSCNRISPEAPVPVVEYKNDIWLLGGAANVANNLSALETKVKLCGLVGSDSEGIILENLLSEKNIENNTIKVINRKTTVKRRILVQNHQLIRIDYEDSKQVDSNLEEKIMSIVERNIDSVSYIILSDYNKGLITNELVAKIVAKAKKNKIKVIVDPKSKDFSRYKGVDIIKPNKKEASLASGVDIHTNADIEKACKIITDKTGCENVIITLSEDGVAYYSDSKLFTIPTRAQEIYDVTGAGDTFLAALAYSLNNNKEIHDACDFANYAASIVISKTGSAVATLSEINNRIKSKFF